MEHPEQIHRAMEKAIAAIKEIYKDENIMDIEVEEVEREERPPGLGEGDWLITVGFTRQKPRYALGGVVIPQRTLKVVRIDPRTCEFKGMKIRNPST